ncbi:MAG: CHAT domain-containing protein, partial [Cyanobacteria bacterium P01_A01_bin.68]
RIIQLSGRYFLEVLSDGHCNRAAIDMTPQDLGELNECFQRAIPSISRNNSQDNPSKQELAELAKIGHIAFNKIFFNSDTRAYIRELTTLNESASIQVVTEDFFLPWEFIYPDNLDEPHSFNNFWGMNHFLSRIIVQEKISPAFVPPEIRFADCAKLGLLTYRELLAVTEKELQFFKKMEDESCLKLRILRCLNPDPNKWREEFNEFRKFWLNGLDLVHFACHAAYDKDSPSSSSILLSKEFSITLQDMDAYELEISGHPLIVMNACQTGKLNPLYTSCFASFFQKYGARGVVATECEIPDTFAAEFTEQLYPHLFQGTPLGESLLATRRYFLNMHQNPAGLIYSMYASPSIRLVNIGSDL